MFLKSATYIAEGHVSCGGCHAGGSSSKALCVTCAYAGKETCGYTSVPTTRGSVRQHSTQSKAEEAENRRIAVYLANKYGYDIDLMPRVNNEHGIRNADSFNHTLCCAQEYKVNTRNTYNSYDMAIKHGRKQASSLVIRLQDDADFNSLARAMHARCKFSRDCPVNDITLIWKRMSHVYKSEEMVRNAFKVRQEDFE